MVQENVIYYNPTNELEDDLNINFKKIWCAIWSRKILLIKVFCLVLAFFILLTFILPKKYTVSADLFINKTNSSNMTEFNPYVLDEATGNVITMGNDKSISNEIQLMKSSLVLDKVIKDNNIVYRKKWGIIPNKKEGEYLTAKAFYGKGKILKIEPVKGTNVITVEYTSKKPEAAYGVITSLIDSYEEVHKALNTEKSKADKKLLEEEYASVKKSLNEKLNQASGLPVQSLSGSGHLTAMSAFSRSASSAMGVLRGQYLAGERSQIAISEESQKIANIASKLEWAKMVEQMSDSSKVLVLHEPRLPRPFEKSSPSLLINIILGCVFGYLSALSALIYVELCDKRLTYSMLTNNIIYDGINDFDSVRAEIVAYIPHKVLLVALTKLPKNMEQQFEQYANAKVLYANFSNDFVAELSKADEVMLISKIHETSSDFYKKMRNIIQKQKKEVIYDILL